MLYSPRTKRHLEAILLSVKDNDSSKTKAKQTHTHTYTHRHIKKDFFKNDGRKNKMEFQSHTFSYTPAHAQKYKHIHMQTHTQPLFQCKASGDLHSQGYMDGATTLLWMPKKKRSRRTKQLRVKTGWYSRDWMNATCSNTSQIPCDCLKWNMGNGLWLHNLVSAGCLFAPFRSLVCLTLSH